MVSEEKLFEKVDDTYDGSVYNISSPGAFGYGELKKTHMYTSILYIKHLQSFKVIGLKV